MKRTSLVLPILALSFVANAATFELRRGDIVEATVEQDWNLKHSREGDKVSMIVDSRDPSLPRGTRFIGTIDRIVKAKKDREAYMDVFIDTIEFPDGHRERIEATPIPLSARGLERDRSGRLVAKDPGKVKSETLVFGGLVGGLLVGSLAKKPFEGAFIGALAGIIANEVQKKDKDVVARKGTKLGLMFERDYKSNYRPQFSERGTWGPDRNRDRDRGRDRDRDRDRRRDW
jgi:hypothetical protein